MTEKDIDGQSKPSITRLRPTVCWGGGGGGGGGVGGGGGGGVDGSLFLPVDQKGAGHQKCWVTGEGGELTQPSKRITG